jgi:hypothetical protein
MDDKSTPVKVESHLDRFEHDLEELERPLSKDSTKMQWVLALLIVLALAGFFYLVTP